MVVLKVILTSGWADSDLSAASVRACVRARSSAVESRPDCSQGRTAKHPLTAMSSAFPPSPPSPLPSSHRATAWCAAWAMAHFGMPS